MSGINNITCPNCEHQFDVEDVILKKLEKDYKNKNLAYQKKIQQEYDEKEMRLSKQLAEFEQKKKHENELFQAKLTKAIEQERDGLRKGVREEYELRMKSANEELENKKKQLQTLQAREVELMKKEAQLKEAQESQKLTLEKELLQRQHEIEEKVRIREREQALLREAQFNKQIEDQKRLIDEMKRKAEQGSMQLQGEVQELAIEEALRKAFPFDIVEEVPKGIRGADSIQTVINSVQSVCGKIIYESKRTKNFSSDWIDKLKSDQIAVGAEIAVIITETMPKEMDSFGQVDGVWICSFQEFMPLAKVLRHLILKVHSTKSAEENKGDKMEIMYKFVTSEEFVQRIKAIIDGFSAMKQGLEKEKRAMTNLWKKREKQIDLVIDNTISLHGSIEGIAGKSFPRLDSLELDSEESHLLIE